MKYLKTIPLSFALGFGITTLFIDTNPDVIKGKFTLVMIMVGVSVIAGMVDDYRKRKSKLKK
jgi:UDP-N-acetylmuramyl pentapeptide phosphotransferase/UDP-N-acetylglucosamine-1-phosphate transferase